MGPGIDVGMPIGDAAWDTIAWALLPLLFLRGPAIGPGLDCIGVIGCGDGFWLAPALCCCEDEMIAEVVVAAVEITGAVDEAGIVVVIVVAVAVMFGIAGGTGTCCDVVRGLRGVGALGRTGVATGILGEFAKATAVAFGVCCGTTAGTGTCGGGGLLAWFAAA
jgi:hypothetical protein